MISAANSQPLCMQNSSSSSSGAHLPARTIAQQSKMTDRKTDGRKEIKMHVDDGASHASAPALSLSASRRPLAGVALRRRRRLCRPGRPAAKASRKDGRGATTEKKKGHERERKKELGRSLGEARHAREAKGGAFRGQPNPDAMEAIDQAMDA